MLPYRHIVGLLQSGGQLIGKQWRHGISYLIELTRLCAAKLKPVGKALQACRLANLNPAPTTVRQFHTLHVTCCSSQIPAGYGACRLVRVKVTGSNAMRFFLIDGNIPFLLWSKEPAVFIVACHQVANRLFHSSSLLLFLGEIERGPMSHANQSLTILRHTIVYSIYHTIFYYVSQFSQF